MSVTLDAVSGPGGTGTNAHLFNRTGLSGGATNTIAAFINVGASASILIVGVVFTDSLASIGTVTMHWDSAGTNQAMTSLGAGVQDPGGTTCGFLFGLVNPTPGAKTLSFSFSGTGFNDNGDFGGISFTGSITSSVAAAIEGYATAAGTSATASVTTGVSIPSGDATTEFFFTDAAQNINSTNLTNIDIDNSASPPTAYSRTSGAGSTVTGTATIAASDNWGALIVGIKAAAAGVIENKADFNPRTFPVVWNRNARLLQNTAQDQSSFGVETNPHWRGRAFPQQWTPLRALMQNSDTNAPFAQPETNTFFIPRTWPPQWNLWPQGRTTAQDFSSFGVETNPHWTGRVWPLQWSLAVRQSPAVDVPATPTPDTPVYFTPRQLPFLWNLSRALGQTTANDFSSTGVETNTFFQPRTWPAQWALQASLMRGTPQDFSTIVTPSGIQYITSLGGIFNPNPGGQAVG